MVRRDAAQGEVDVWHGESQQDTQQGTQQSTQRTLSADVALLFCASGSITLTPGDAEPQSLDAGDTLRIDMSNALPCALEGAGSVLAISIRYTQR